VVISRVPDRGSDGETPRPGGAEEPSHRVSGGGRWVDAPGGAGRASGLLAGGTKRPLSRAARSCTQSLEASPLLTGPVQRI
jgi:hypothetical protein